MPFFRANLLAMLASGWIIRMFRQIGHGEYWYSRPLILSFRSFAPAIAQTSVKWCWCLVKLWSRCEANMKSQRRNEFALKNAQN